MSLDDRDIFTAICNKFPDQPIEFIMAQYEKAKMMNIDIERRVGSAVPEIVAVEVEEPVEIEEVVDEPAPKKKYTRKKMVVKPEDSITDTDIACCICGQRRQSLTRKHLDTHGISVEEYKKICGFPPDQALMSRKRYTKSLEIIKRAQKKRLEKKAAMAED